SKMLVRASSRSAIGRDMRGGLRELTQANERLVSAISDGKIRHPGEQTTAGRALTRHTLNARRRPNQYGLSFGKASRESTRKVDAYPAMLLADLARHRLIESGRRVKSGHSGVVYFFYRKGGRCAYRRGTSRPRFEGAPEDWHRCRSV